MEKYKNGMVITQTPFRISFFGGGTDFPDFFNKYGGSVISTTINKYCYVNVRDLPPFHEFKTELIYLEREKINNNAEIKHPLIREAMNWFNLSNLRVIYDADLPARSGLGTSSSFAVGLISAFYSLTGKFVDKKKLAKDSIYLERFLCKESGGIQDQIAASYGGFNRIDFNENDFTVKPITISKDRIKELDNKLLLFFTGYSRFSSKIQDKFIENIDKKNDILNQLKNTVDKAEQILIGDGNLDEFGKLLDFAWELKKSTSNEVTNENINEYYNKAKKAGALGGKILGAGGGGFLLFYVSEENQMTVRSALSDLMEVNFNFENGGTRVIFYSQEDK